MSGRDAFSLSQKDAAAGGIRAGALRPLRISGLSGGIYQLCVARQARAGAQGREVESLGVHVEAFFER